MVDVRGDVQIKYLLSQRTNGSQIKQRLHHSAISSLVRHDSVTVSRRSVLVTIRTQVYGCSYAGKADGLQYKLYNCNQYI